MKIEDTKAWLDERLSISTLTHLADKKEVPLHRHSIWYYFGGMTMFLFCVQVVTGILLLLYYRPSAENAFESVQFIITEVKFGWLIRSIHSWSANLMIATLFIHMFSVFFLRAYYPPREITWVSGAVLLFIVICFGFSGYLLPWNKLAFFATKVGTEIAGVIPIVVMRDLIGWILAIGVLAALAALFPWELGEKADAFAPAPAGIKPEWYFLFMFQTLKWIPAKIFGLDGEVLGIMAFNGIALLLFIVPFIDRDPENRRRHLIMNVIGVIALLYIVVMTIVGYVAK